MKTNKFLVMAAMALGLGVFAACSNDDEPNVPESKGNTYVGVSIAFPQFIGSRALPEDYNKNGEWKGRDKIEKVTVFLVNSTLQTIDYTTFTDQFEGIDENGYLAPKLAVKATPGHKVKAYVVVNDMNDKITSDLKKSTYNNFSTNFAEAVPAKASDVSKTDTDNKEVILMTNDVDPTNTAAEIDVKPNISETEAKKKDATANQCKVTVSRVVSRGLVTMDNTKEMKFEIKRNNVTTHTVTIKNVTYSIGQGNRKFFILRDKDYKTPGPVYEYTPTSKDWETNYPNYFDYDPLQQPHNEVKKIADKENVTVTGVLKEETTSKFLLPITHPDDKYRKGNSSYFEITAKFTIDGTLEDTKAPYVEGESVFLGLNDGKFYSSREKAEESGQKATEYKKGVMKYVLWLNPDQQYGGTTKIKKSPTVRNNVYHAHITGFKEMGVPNNPLNPEDPNDPKNPENPIKPEDPLQTEDTYLSVSINVLPWTIHSYSVDLGNDY